MGWVLATIQMPQVTTLNTKPIHVKIEISINPKLIAHQPAFYHGLEFVHSTTDLCILPGPRICALDS